MNASRICKRLILTITLFLVGCGLLDQSATKKPSSSGLIATPVTYYSTSRARYLGAKYKENLDRLVERIVRNTKTANLQFANNIASVGGIGFFTHSATKTADERYLEVVLAAPETFEIKGAHSDKVNRLFNMYGTDLLAILSGDNDIYQDKELTGYGLNLSWRNVSADPAGNRVTLERAIVYLSKEKTRSFLRRELNQNALLADATIFTVEEDGPLNLISYREPEVRQEFRSAIREDDIPPAPAATKPVPSPIIVKTDSPEPGKKDALPVREPVAKVAPPKPPLAVVQKPRPSSLEAPVIPPRPAASAPVIAAPAEAPVLESAPLGIAKLEVTGPVTIPARETKEVAPVVEPEVKPTVPAPAMMDASKLMVEPKVPPSPAVETAQPKVVAPAPRAEAESPPAIPNKLGESGAAAQVVNERNPPPLVLKPFLAPASPAATNTPAPEPLIVEKTAPPSAARAATKAAEIAREPATAVTSPQPPPASLVPAAAPTVATRAPLEIETPARPVVAVPPTPMAKAATKPVEVVSAPPVIVKPVPPQVPAERPLPAPAPIVTKAETPIVIDTPVPPAVAGPTAVPEKAPARPPAEQLVSLVKPPEVAPAKPAIARTAPKALEGFIIQLAFSDRDRAQRWAEAMEKKGFAVSVTQADAEGALRVRLGNFVLRDDAERQLKAIKQEGLNGIILNLPQAFRPEARTSIP